MINILFHLLCTLPRYSCAIQDLTSKSVIITGGSFGSADVARYDMEGFVEDLPRLQVG